jgi:hypothetical protein
VLEPNCCGHLRKTVGADEKVTYRAVKPCRHIEICSPAFLTEDTKRGFNGKRINYQLH